MTDSFTSLRDWMFRAVMFEAEAERFRNAGLRIGANQTDVEVRLMEEVLTPFPIELREKAMRMTRLYALLFCFENSVRQLIRDRMIERYGTDWWANKVPMGVQRYVKQVQQKAADNNWLEGEKGDELQFALFGHLADIITNLWDDFSDLIPSQHWIRQRMEDLEQARNFLAHNRLLLTGEFQRIETYVGDWNRQVGV